MGLSSPNYARLQSIVNYLQLHNMLKEGPSIHAYKLQAHHLCLQVLLKVEGVGSSHNPMYAQSKQKCRLTARL